MSYTINCLIKILRRISQARKEEIIINQIHIINLEQYAGERYI